MMWRAIFAGPYLAGEAYEGKPSESTVERQWWVNSKFAWGGLVGSLRERSADVPKNNKRGRVWQMLGSLRHRMPFNSVNEIYNACR